LEENHMAFRRRRYELRDKLMSKERKALPIHLGNLVKILKMEILSLCRVSL
jgi:hypothetical protein